MIGGEAGEFDSDRNFSLLEPLGRTFQKISNIQHALAGRNDLAEAMRGLAASVKKMFDVACVFSVTGEIPSVPENVTMQLCKIAQEAVSNAADVKRRVEQLKRDGKKSVLLLVANSDGELRFVALSVQ